MCSFFTRRSFSEPLDLAEGRNPPADALRDASLAPITHLSSVSPGFSRQGVCESGDLLAPKSSRQDTSFSDFGSPSSCLGLTLRSVPPDPPPVVKSLRALHQICEEEEEEEEDQPVIQCSKVSLVPSAAPPLHTSPKCCLVSKAPSVSEKLWVKEKDKSKELGLCEVLAEDEELQGEGETITEESQEDTGKKITKSNETASQIKIQSYMFEDKRHIDQSLQHYSGHTPVEEDHAEKTRKEGKSPDRDIDKTEKDHQQLVGLPGGSRTEEKNHSEGPGTAKHKEQNHILQKLAESPNTEEKAGKAMKVLDRAKSERQKDLQKTDRCLTVFKTDKNQTEYPSKTRKVSDRAKDERNKELLKSDRPLAAAQIEDKNLTEESQKAGRASDKAENEGHKNQKLERFPAPPRLDPVQCCWGQSEHSNDTVEDNNNTPSKPGLLDTSVISAPCISPRFLPKNHCVDLRPDGVETRKVLGEAERKEETYGKSQQGQRGSRYAGTDSNKNKNVNLRERLLQFPLCEKALSFNIQPTSKEKLLPFAQYNCCHVL